MKSNYWIIESNNFRNENQGITRTAKIRDHTPYNEVFEIRRKFVHPLYEFPKFYYDIAVLELGNFRNIRKKCGFIDLLFFIFIERRIIYDFDEYGDAPACLNESENIEDKIALLQGFGLQVKIKILHSVKIIPILKLARFFPHHVGGGKMRQFQNWNYFWLNGVVLILSWL